MKPRRETLTKKDLCDEIAARTKQSRAVVRLIVQEFLDGIVERLNKGQRLEFREFGVFEIKQRAARACAESQDARAGERAGQANDQVQARAQDAADAGARARERDARHQGVPRFDPRGVERCGRGRA
jgi:nucleoid DNA-binding protein